MSDSRFDLLFEMIGKDQSKPDFVNDAGVAWWMDNSTTKFARQPDVHGTSLQNITAWVVKETNGNFVRVLTDGTEVVVDTPSLESLGVHIDMLKAAQRLR